jgi:hypothetical protein
MTDRKQGLVGPSKSKIHHRSSTIDVFEDFEELISGTFTSCGGEISSQGLGIKVPDNAIKKNIQSITILVIYYYYSFIHHFFQVSKLIGRYH